MTDRELLELAAKAVGIELSEGDHGDMLRVYFTDPHNGLRRYTVWNPLTDDGDAFRLAVKLNLSVCVELDQTWIASKGCPTTPLCFVNHDGDPYAATRRSVVRAAAEIGKQMGGSDE